MAGFFSQLVKGAVAGRTGHLQGQRLGEEDARLREEQETERGDTVRRMAIQEAILNLRREEAEREASQPKAPVKGTPEYLQALLEEENAKTDSEVGRRKRLRDQGLLWEPNSKGGSPAEKDGPLPSHVTKRTVEFQEPRRGQYSGDPEIPGLPLEEAHGRAIDEALTLGMAVPKSWLEHAAKDPAYAEHLLSHGIDPKTGQKINIPANAVSVGEPRLPN